MGSGSSLPRLHDALRTATDAAKVLSGSLHSIKSDVEERTGNIIEGAQKIQEGKEQMQKGLRGDNFQ
jgi:hypothetical protein